MDENLTGLDQQIVEQFEGILVELQDRFPDQIDPDRIRDACKLPLPSHEEIYWGLVLTYRIPRPVAQEATGYKPTRHRRPSHRDRILAQHAREYEQENQDE